MVRLLTVCMVALSALAACGKETSPVSTSPPATSASAPQTQAAGPVRIVLCNIRYPEASDGENAWPKRRELLLRALDEPKPDLIALQEVTPVQGAYLIQNLPEFAHYPDGRDEGGGLAPLTSVVSSLNLVLYRKDRFDVVASRHGPVRDAGTTAPDPRQTTFFTMVTLKDRTKALPELIVVNTHLRHDQRAATLDAREINNRITAERRLRPGAEVVLLGDFNADKFTPVYAAARGDAKAFPAGTPVTELVDTYDYSKMAPGTRWGSWHAFTGTPRGAWPSDIVFVSGGLKASAVVVIKDNEGGRYPSDHFPVSVEVRWK